jgi:hypothetical protein
MHCGKRINAALVCCLNDNDDKTRDGHRSGSTGVGNCVVCGLVMFDNDSSSEADFQDVN